MPGESEDEPRSHFWSWSSTPNHESLKSSPNKDSQPFSYLQFPQVKNSKNLTEREYFDVRHSKFPRSSLKSHGKSQRHNYETNHDSSHGSKEKGKVVKSEYGRSDHRRSSERHDSPIKKKKKSSKSLMYHQEKVIKVIKFVSFWQRVPSATVLLLPPISFFIWFVWAEIQWEG